MYSHILAQAGSTFTNTLFAYFMGLVIVFFIGLYIFRAVFNIPSFLRYQKAQIRLLEEIAKNQGVDSAKVQSIISESIEWESMKQWS